MSLLTDYTNLLGQNAGSSATIGGVPFQRTGTGVSWTNPTGATGTIGIDNPYSGLNTLYSMPYINKSWDTAYGTNPLSGISNGSFNLNSLYANPNATLTNGATSTGLDLSGLSTANPYSMSSSSGGSSQSSENQSQYSSLSDSLSKSGINWQNPLASGLMPTTLQEGLNLPNVVNQMGQTLTDQYNDMIQRALGPEAFQGTINDLASKGMLNSSVGGDAISQMGSNLAKSVADKAYEAQLAQQQAKLQVPSMLAQLLQLAQESMSQSTSTSQGTSSGTSSGGSSQSSQSYQVDPLSKYNTLFDFYSYQPQTTG
jgi:hypothetical protein